MMFFVLICFFYYYIAKKCGSSYKYYTYTAQQSTLLAFIFLSNCLLLLGYQVYFSKSFATHSTHSSMLSVSFLSIGKGMIMSGAMPRPSDEKFFS